MGSPGGQDDRPTGRSRGQAPRRPLRAQPPRPRPNGYPDVEGPDDGQLADEEYPDDAFGGGLPRRAMGDGAIRVPDGGRPGGGRHGAGRHAGGQAPLDAGRPGGGPAPRAAGAGRPSAAAEASGAREPRPGLRGETRVARPDLPADPRGDRPGFPGDARADRRGARALPADARGVGPGLPGDAGGVRPEVSGDPRDSRPATFPGGRLRAGAGRAGVDPPTGPRPRTGLDPRAGLDSRPRPDDSRPGLDSRAGTDSRPGGGARPGVAFPPERGAALRGGQLSAGEQPGDGGYGRPGDGRAQRPDIGEVRGRGGYPGPGRGSRGPIRGHPPTPGQPDPVYPPGQFSLWNRPSVRMNWLGVAASDESAKGGDADPGYAHLAVSDPSADATSTQTWAAIEDTGGWRAQRPGRRAADHSDHGTYPGARVQAERAVGPFPEPGRGQRAGGPSQATPGPARARRPRDPGGARSASARDDAPTALRGPGGQADFGAAARPAARRSGAAAGADGGGKGVRARTASARAAAGRSGRSPGRPAGRSNRLLAVLLAAPVAVVIAVVAVYVYLSSGPSLTGHVAAPTASHAASSSPAALGVWKHIETRADDPRPLSLAELFPPQFASSGAAGTRTAQRAGSHCAGDVVGSSLQSAVRKAGCTQVMRASYLSTNGKLMATIGVLNLASATDAQRAGAASGATEFISQLPGRRGPTKKLAQGTGLEEAELKGHYLILIWAEFANLNAPSGKRQRGELEQFSAGLINGTVNASLSSRMVTGQPVAAP